MWFVCLAVYMNGIVINLWVSQLSGSDDVVCVCKPLHSSGTLIHTLCSWAYIGVGNAEARCAACWALGSVVSAIQLKAQSFFPSFFSVFPHYRDGEILNSNRQRLFPNLCCPPCSLSLIKTKGAPNFSTTVSLSPSAKVGWRRTIDFLAPQSSHTGAGRYDDRGKGSETNVDQATAKNHR